MSLDFTISLEELEAAEASTANPYLSDPARGLQLVARLVGQPLPDAVQDQQRDQLARLHDLIHRNFIELTAKGSYPGEAQALRELLALEQSLENLALFPDLASKTVVGVGGGFSAGKSRFLNTLLGVDLLPESLEPTTAIPSFITRGDADRIVALNRFNHQVGLDHGALQAITHAFNQHYRDSLGETFGFAHVLKLLMLHSTALRWRKLAFLDTPGYSKADVQHAAQTDEGIALKQLTEADHVLWLLSAKNGSIRQDDLQFLRALDHPKPVFFVVTQADLVGESRIAAILGSTRQAIQQAGIACAGLMAWAAPLGAEFGARMAGDDINAWLQDLEREQKRTQYGRQCQRVIDGYIHHNRRCYADSRDRISALNHVQLIGQELPPAEQATLKEMLKEQRAGQAIFNQQIEAFTRLKSELVEVVSAIAMKFSVEELSGDELFLKASKYYARDEFEAAFEYFQEAAELGNVDAQYELASCFYFGRGTDENEESAVVWYRKAAESGHIKAQFQLAQCYFRGRGVEKDEGIAVIWYGRAAEQGHAEAQCMLGVFYNHGTGVPKSESTAVIWYRKAAEQGYARAQRYLGVCYQHGTGVPKNETEAVTWHQKAADQGDPVAQCNLGLCCEHGTGVPKSEIAAVIWYRKAAEQDYARAQCNLGVCYQHGTGVPKSEREAVTWYRKAAGQGDARAQSKLGDCYYYGAGIWENKESAVLWYRKAAEQGHAYAQYSLAFCYYHGYGVGKDKASSGFWYRKAAAQGNEAAIADLKKYF